MKIKIIPILTLGILALSCNNKITFIVENNTGFPIDSLRITPDSEEKFTALKNGEKLTYVANMNGIPKSDGAYTMSYRNKESGEKYRRIFGYYTNGTPLEEQMHIRIEKDSLNFDGH